MLITTTSLTVCRRQAFTNIQKKYAGTEIGGANTSAAKDNTKDVEKPKKTTAKASKKRGAEDDVKEKKGRVKKAKKSETPAPVEDEDRDGGGVWRWLGRGCFRVDRVLGDTQETQTIGVCLGLQ